MDIQELANKKRELGEKLMELIKDFNQNTGTYVKKVDIGFLSYRNLSTGERQHQPFECSVEIEI